MKTNRADISIGLGILVVAIVASLVIRYFRTESKEVETFIPEKTKNYNVDCELGIEKVEFYENGLTKSITCKTR